LEYNRVRNAKFVDELNSEDSEEKVEFNENWGNQL